MALPLFAVTLFASAFLLFLVQPMIGKMILPKLGGTPQVWNTCMVFFQTALLAGYAYTHTISTRLSLRRQMFVHGALLAVPLLFLLPIPPFYGPFNVQQFNPSGGGNPIWQTLGLLAMIVGIPFFVVSTSAPLLQKWFASTGHPSAHDPYFLYGASNLGSLLSLLAYPFIVEWLLPLQTQAFVWAGAYVILAGTILACSAMVFKTASPEELAHEPSAQDVPSLEQPVPQPLPEGEGAAETGIKAGEPAAASSTSRAILRRKGQRLGAATPDVSLAGSDGGPKDDEVTLGRRLRWILCAAVPVSLMLGVTSYVSVDLSPFPLLWVIPLALYLLSFILVFAKFPVPWTGSPHQILVFIAPVGIFLICRALTTGGFDPATSTFTTFIGFFLIAMLCHGELASDRPTTRHLTEFFLLMSFGGMLGGMFNGIFAPILFKGVAEFPIALGLAAFLWPKTRESGWMDDVLLNASPQFKESVVSMGDQMARNRGKPAPRSPYVFANVMDVVLGLFFMLLLGWACKAYFTTEKSFDILRFLGFSEEGAYGWLPNAVFFFGIGIPMLFCYFFLTRPIRFGLGVCSILLINLVFMNDDNRKPLAADRTYFGVLRIFDRKEPLVNTDRQGNILGMVDPSLQESNTIPMSYLAKNPVGRYTFLMHGTTYHGQNWHFPPQLRRLATTYYHRMGPVGAVMERYNWAPGPQNTFWADNRMPVSLVGLAASPLGTGVLPLDQILGTQSEPPIATIGLGTGTVASYVRPFQHIAYYEIDNVIRSYSEPIEVEVNTRPEEQMVDVDDRIQRPWFTYLQDAWRRGGMVEVIMGDARLTMEKEDPKLSRLFAQRDRYYKAIEVDAFSSDAIPIHLITREAIQLYRNKITPDGVILVHTSNRHLDLVQPVTKIAEDLGLDWRVGKDAGKSDRRRGQGSDFLGHFGSEYVLLAEKGVLEDLYKIPRTARSGPIPGSIIHWSRPSPPPEAPLWTDNYSNILRIIR